MTDDTTDWESLLSDVLCDCGLPIAEGCACDELIEGNIDYDKHAFDEDLLDE